MQRVENASREQLSMALVAGHLLVEKGLIDEEEIEDAHQRMVVEPAIIAGEQESLLDELTDSDQIRERLVRNTPVTLQ